MFLNDNCSVYGGHGVLCCVPLRCVHLVSEYAERRGSMFVQNVCILSCS